MLDLERLGSTVSVMQADVADAAQVASLVERVHARFGPLSGVIHAAGATRADAFGPVAGLTSEAVEQHLRPKVIGVQNLAEAVVDEPLDFCLLVSSLSSLLGGLRFAGYAAANAYLDAFAIARARTGAPWTSVDWDGWDFAGTAAKGSLALTRAEGMERVRPTAGGIASRSSRGVHRRLGRPLRPVGAAGVVAQHRRTGRGDTGDGRRRPHQRVGPPRRARSPRPRHRLRGAGQTRSNSSSPTPGSGSSESPGSDAMTTSSNWEGTRCSPCSLRRGSATRFTSMSECRPCSTPPPWQGLRQRSLRPCWHRRPATSSARSLTGSKVSVTKRSPPCWPTHDPGRPMNPYPNGSGRR